MSNIMRRDPGGYGQRSVPPPAGGYYYSSRGPSAAPSPSQHSYRSEPPMAMQTPRGMRGPEPPRMEEQTPSYFVEHLATFAVGRQFGLVAPADGLRKLKQMEKSSAIWAQPMVLRLRPNTISVENENGELVEQFPLELVEQPTAHVSNDSRDAYNNILLFVVREDTKGRKNTTPTEMHIFQCSRVSASEVAEDLQHYIRGQFKKVRNGRRATQGQGSANFAPQGYGASFPDDVSISSEGSEMFERDVNTLNRCFDEIERFVARVQSAALAQRELETQAHRYRTAQRRDKRAPPPDPHGILQMRAQLPLENEFVDVLRKFKLSFNLLAKLRNHIHEPNAPELVHFLFTPLTVILDASHWGLGRNISPQVVSPLLSLEARELMQNCLSSKETDIWMSLGEAWRTPPEDWPGPLPPAYRPVFLDGFAPYGAPEPRGSRQTETIHRGQSEPPAPYRPRERTSETLDLERLSLEKERIEFEREKIRERQKRLEEEDRRIRQEKERLKKEQEMLQKERERTNSISENPPPRGYSSHPEPYHQASPQTMRKDDSMPMPLPIPFDPEVSPRQRAFVQDVVNRRCKLVQATYDRVAQNQKELTVSRGEYLEVLNDTKNWWECKNVHNRVGYVPHTILTVVPLDGPTDMQQEEIYVGPSQNTMQMQSPIHHNGNGAIPNGYGPQSGVTGRVPPMYVADAGVQANVQPRIVERIIPAPPPQPTFAQQITQKPPLRKVVPQPEQPKGPKMVLERRQPHEEMLIRELTDTLPKKAGEKIVLQKKPIRSTVRLTEKTTPEGVQIWLKEKGFSMRLIDLLVDQDGAALFSLSKHHLEMAAGRDEGARLYSQLLVEKSRSNFQTKSRAELNAILNYRRNHVELSNEAAPEEPNEVAQGVSIH